MTRLLSVVGLAWLYCTIGELQPIEYLKSVFLEILNVTTWTVFQNKVTYEDSFTLAITYKYLINKNLTKIEPKQLLQTLIQLK